MGYASWICLFCLATQLVSILHGMQPSAVDDPIKKFLRVQSFDTGYEKMFTFDRSELENRQEEYVKIITAVNFNQLKCGYLFGTQMHLYLTEKLVFKTDTPIMPTADNVGNFLFVNEASLMIESLFPEIPWNMHEVWLVYAYAFKIGTFYQGIADGRITNDDKDTFNQYQTMHEYVSSHIRHYVQTNCIYKNDFNMMYKGNKLYKRRKSIKHNIVQNAETAMKLMKENKSLLLERYNENVTRGLSRSLESTITESVLYFRSADNFQLLIREFLAEMHNLLRPNIEEKYRKVFEDGLRGIKALRLYQDTVFETINVIILRITWTFVLFLNDMMDAGKDGTEQYANTYGAEILATFMDDMSLNDNHFFKNLRRYFDKAYWSGTYSEKTTILNDIQQNLNNITHRLEFPKTTPIQSSESINDVMNTAKEFILKVKELIGNRTTIKMIKSFSKMVTGIP